MRPIKTLLMQTNHYNWQDLGVTVECSFFSPSSRQESVSCTEIHAMLHVDARDESFVAQMQRLALAEKRLKTLTDLTTAHTVFKRYFVSDATNQNAQLQQILHSEGLAEGALSVIQQSPLDGSKVALWIYLVTQAEVTSETNDTVVSHNGYQHHYHWGMVVPEGDSYAQTQALLERYEASLNQINASLEQNCIRTWFFVRDVDIQYMGMVKARKQNFIEQGLTEKTHYIASTGIGGLPADPKAIVQLGCYALKGFEPQQQQYLYAKSHLNPTYEYGVTFERGVKIEYGDRAHLYISGTASINNKGEVMHVGDVVKQTQRMWENVEQLLAEGNASFADVAQIIVYLRDMADYQVVRAMFNQRFPNTPVVFTLAPVCRPTWLIEMECIAISQHQNSQYRNF